MNATGEAIIDVQVASDDGDVPGQEKIRDWVAAVTAVAELGLTSETELSVRVVDAPEMQALNREYRDKDTPTNVLSFPAGEIAGLPDGEARMIGDVVICAEVVRSEAAEQGKALDDHWAHMLVHGMLHLLGYDHINDTEASEMERLEARILASLGITDPYRV